MPLPHFRQPLNEGWIAKDSYDVIFIYNEYKPDDLSHNFGDIIMIVVHVYNHNGEIIRRKVFDVNLSHYRQMYETDNFEKYIEGNYSRIELLFRITKYDVSEFEAGNSIPFDVWFRDYKINKIIG